MKTRIVLFALLALIGWSNETNAQWQQTNGAGNINVASFAIKGTVMLAATDAGIFRSIDHGDNWTNVNTTNFYCYTSNSMTASNTNFLLAGYNNIGVMMSTDSGATWVEVTNGLESSNKYMHSVFSNGATVFTGYEDQGVFKSIDNGNNWNDVSVALGNGARIDSWTTGGSNTFAGDYGKVYLSANGTSWTSVSAGLPASTIKSLVISGSSVLAGTDGHGIYKSINNGTNWTIVTDGMSSTAVINSLAVSGTSVFAATSNGIFKSTDNGTSWTDISNGLTNLNVTVLSISGTSILAGTTGAGIWMRPLSELTGIQQHSLAATIKIYPNPCTSMAALQSDKNFTNATLTVYNSFGQQVKEIKNISGNTVTLFRDDLPSGVYFLQLAQDNKVITTDKLVITD